jgi:hypothetical protein
MDLSLKFPHVLEPNKPTFVLARADSNGVNNRSIRPREDLKIIVCIITETLQTLHGTTSIKN